MNTDTAASNIAVYSGRPVSEEGRLPREIQVYDFWISSPSLTRGLTTHRPIPLKPAGILTRRFR